MWKRAGFSILAAWLCASAGSGCALFHRSADAAPPSSAADHVQTGTGVWQGGQTASEPALHSSTLPWATVPTAIDKTAQAPANYVVPEQGPPPEVPMPRSVPAVFQQPPNQPSSPINASPAPAYDPIVLALDCLLRDKPTEALDHLNKLTPNTGELMMRLFAVAAHLRDKNVDKLSAKEMRELQSECEGILRTVEQLGDLAIETMCLCRHVDGYFHYEALPPDFNFHSGDRVQLLVQLRNTNCKPRGAEWVFALNTKITIVDASGNEQYFRNLGYKELPLPGPEPSRLCQSTSYFTVPPNVPAGKYRLRIQVEDVSTVPHRTAERSIDFFVGSTGP
jgi:hypothetical protein